MLNDAKNAYNTTSGTYAATGDIQMPACMLYALLFAGADAHNSALNAYSTHDAANSS